ncbi:hypothetical protein KCU71_g15065, partial [Aureobasidium melanogenum]
LVDLFEDGDDVGGAVEVVGNGQTAFVSCVEGEVFHGCILVALASSREHEATTYPRLIVIARFRRGRAKPAPADEKFSVKEDADDTFA